MKIGIINRDPYLDNNQIFKFGLIPDGILDFWYYLKLELQTKQIEITTIESYFEAKSCDLLFFNELPKKISSKYKMLDLHSRKFLFIGDCPLVIPENYKLDNLHNFEKVFTWNEKLLSLDNKIFVKSHFNLPIKKLLNPEAIYIEKKIDVCLIAANKKIKGFGELYSHRKKIIDYLDDTNINFELYGPNWDKIRFSSHNLSGKIANRLFSKFKISSPKSWKGRANSKLDIYFNCSSSFAIENAAGFPGYVTEKIIHSILGFTIPLYFGDPNVSLTIPSEFYTDITNLEPEEIFNIIIENKHKNNLNFRKRQLDFILNDGLAIYDSDTLIDSFCKHL
jgi:hypothetical protein